MELEDLFKALHEIWEMIELIGQIGFINFILIVGAGVFLLYLFSLAIKNDSGVKQTPPKVKQTYARYQEVRKDSPMQQNRPALPAPRNSIIKGNGFTMRESD